MRLKQYLNEKGKKETFEDYDKWEKAVKKIDKNAIIKYLYNSRTILQALYADSSYIIGEWDKSSKTGWIKTG